jgi:hypothetical protein
MYKVEISYGDILPENMGQIRIWFWSNDFLQLILLKFKMINIVLMFWLSPGIGKAMRPAP